MILQLKHTDGVLVIFIYIRDCKRGRLLGLTLGFALGNCVLNTLHHLLVPRLLSDA